MKAEMWTDGGCRGAPGPSALGFVIKDMEGNTLRKHGQHIGMCTNNQSEYCAVISGLYNAHCMGIKDLTVYTDSQVVQGQLSGEWKVQSENLKPYYHEAVEELEKFDKVVFKWIPRRENKEADQLTRDILDKEE